MYTMQKTMQTMIIAMATVALADVEAATSTAETTIAVDTRTGECRAVGQAAVGYSPSWGGVTNAGAYVVLQKVVNGVTNNVATFAADAEASYSYEPGIGDPCFVRMIHRVYSSGGVEIGDPLVSDIAFGYRSVEGTSFIADSRTNSLQEAVSSGGLLNLAYSTAWTTNAASVSIKAVRLSCSGGDPTATNDVFAAAADADGVVARRGPGRGWWQYLCRLTDGSDNVLLEYLTGEFKMSGGFVIGFR